MALVLQIASGSRAGHRAEFTKSSVVAGRHSDCDLRFDATGDLDVSTRHAEFRGGETGWTVQDLGSTNGTWLNGERIAGARSIRAGDTISFGAAGPRIDVTDTGSLTDLAPPRTVQRDSRNLARPGTEQRIAMAVAAQTGHLKKLVIGIAALVVVGAGVLIWLNQRSAAESRAAIARILQQSDSLRNALERTVADASAQAAGFDSVARVLRRDRDQLTQALQAGGGNVAQLTSQIGALDRRTNQALSLTNRQISEANGKAVGYIVVEDQAKNAFGGTAFSVSPGGLLVTNSHVLLDAEGRPPRRIAVYFADTDLAVPARFVGTVPGADLGFVQLEKPGTYPTVRGIGSHDALGVGDPVVVMGFPLGTELPQQGSVMKTTTTYGFVSKLLMNQIQINAYAAQGSSGSPVFDSRGYVIGVLNSGQGSTSSVITFLVPSSALIAALPAEAKGIVRE